MMTKTMEPLASAVDTHGFHLMAKPAGPRCPLQCRYCFYTEKQETLDRAAPFRMTDAMLETYVRTYIAAQPGPEVHFAWQGGEPTLMGLDFFRHAVALQKRYARAKRIHNALQTSGVLLDEGWCRFLRREGFLVGLSLDGPREIHDRFRVDRHGNPSFDRVMTALKRMRDEGVEFNTLTAVTREGAAHPVEIYEFLRQAGAQFMQFIPIVERAADDGERAMGLSLAQHGAAREQAAAVMPWSVSAEAYGAFLVAMFDRWVERDVGKVFVQHFDTALSAWMGMEPPLCMFAETCGRALVVEHNGDVYSCDHYVYPEHRLGNLAVDEIGSMLAHPRLQALGQGKRDLLPRICRECPFLFVCHGGCPKNRFAVTDDGEPGWNYLCHGYRRFFEHVDPAMRRMAGFLRQGRPAADIMPGSRPLPLIASPRPAGPPGARKTAGRNDPCPCGSGRKYKKCCG